MANAEIVELFQNDADAQRALLYVLGLQERKTKTDIAKDLGVSRQYLYELEDRWESDGTLDRVYQAILNSRVSNIQIAVDEVLQKWPEVILDALKIATSKEYSGRMRMEAKEWLFQRVVQPAIAEKKGSGSKELSYANSDQAFDPTSIPDGEIQVIVQTQLPTIIQQTKKP